MAQARFRVSKDRPRLVTIGPMQLEGILTVPEPVIGLVIFAHGSGSSRLSPRNTYVAEQLQSRAMATLLFDLLTDEEASDRRNVFHVPLLASRLEEAISWAWGDPETAGLPIGLFGASTGSAAALVASAANPEIAAVVSRGGRPDLAGDALSRIRAPTLLIVGGADTGVLELNQDAFARLNCAKRLHVVPAATHLFEEPGALDEVVQAAGDWFALHLQARRK
ncbi:MAG TPA: alpha/beta family hydrolase [Methyloceanibacter sp.]|nr:alpha/beta family hydrolase [Methyloceanibacter sp.]